MLKWKADVAARRYREREIRCSGNKLMFDEQLFHSWPAVLVGATCFAALFAVAVTLGESLFDGTWQMTRSAAALGAAAFAGYVGISWMIRTEKSSSEDA